MIDVLYKGLCGINKWVIFYRFMAKKETIDEVVLQIPARFSDIGFSKDLIKEIRKNNGSVALVRDSSSPIYRLGMIKTDPKDREYFCLQCPSTDYSREGEYTEHKLQYKNVTGLLKGFGITFEVKLKKSRK